MQKKASGRHLDYPRIRLYSVIDNDYVIEKIVVRFRDVTELRKMQTEAAIKEVELGIKSELAVMDEQCFHKFIAQALGFVEDNKWLLSSSQIFGKDALKTLFINMHTLKGLARSYNLARLTSMIHDNEENR